MIQFKSLNMSLKIAVAQVAESPDGVEQAAEKRGGASASPAGCKKARGKTP